MAWEPMSLSPAVNPEAFDFRQAQMQWVKEGRRMTDNATITPFHAQAAEDVLQALETTTTGLSSDEA
eukprot:gene15629-20713_t